MDQGQTNSTEKKSKYNDALATLMRIDEIWKRAYSHASSGKFGRWNSDLDTVWRELSEDVAEGSKEEKAYNQINKDLASAGLFTLTNSASEGFNGTTGKKTEDRVKISILLQKKEVFLRRLKGKQGKGTVYEDSVDDYMD